MLAFQAGAMSSGTLSYRDGGHEQESNQVQPHDGGSGDVGAEALLNMSFAWVGWGTEGQGRPCKVSTYIVNLQQTKPWKNQGRGRGALIIPVLLYVLQVHVHVCETCKKMYDDGLFA